MVGRGTILRLQTANEGIIRRPPTNIRGAFIQVAYDKLHQGLRHVRETITLFLSEAPLQFTRFRPYGAQLIEGVGGLIGKILYLGSDHGKSPAYLTSSRRFYGGVERKNIDLACDSSIHLYIVFDPCFYATNDVIDAQTAHIGTLSSQQPIARRSA